MYAYLVLFLERHISMVLLVKDLLSETLELQLLLKELEIMGVNT